MGKGQESNTVGRSSVCSPIRSLLGNSLGGWLVSQCGESVVSIRKTSAMMRILVNQGRISYFKKTGRSTTFRLVFPSARRAKIKSSSPLREKHCHSAKCHKPSIPFTSLTILTSQIFITRHLHLHL